MGIGFTLTTLKALNGSGINCFVLKVSKHWVSVLSYNYVWPRGPALFATLGVPNAAGSPETCRRASSHACYSTVTPICSVADLSRSNPNKPVFQVMVHGNYLLDHSNQILQTFGQTPPLPGGEEQLKTIRYTVSGPVSIHQDSSICIHVFPPVTITLRSNQPSRP